MSDIKDSGTSEPSEGATVDTKSVNPGDVVNSTTSGSTTTESLPPATLDNGLPGTPY
jgi:hypothetical protein